MFEIKSLDHISHSYILCSPYCPTLPRQYQSIGITLTPLLLGSPSFESVCLRLDFPFLHVRMPLRNVASDRTPLLEHFPAVLAGEPIDSLCLFEEVHHRRCHFGP